MPSLASLGTGTEGRGHPGTLSHRPRSRCGSVSPGPPYCPSLPLGTRPGPGVQAWLRVRVPAPGARWPCPPPAAEGTMGLCAACCARRLIRGTGPGGRAPWGGAGGGFKGQSRLVSPVPGVPEPSSPACAQATAPTPRYLGQARGTLQGHPPAGDGGDAGWSPGWAGGTDLQGPPWLPQIWVLGGPRAGGRSPAGRGLSHVASNPVTGSRPPHGDTLPTALGVPDPVGL